MSKPLSFTKYHELVLSQLRSLTWVQKADSYPDEDIVKYQGLKTPAVYFNVSGWEGDGLSAGQTEVTLDCELFIVVDCAGKNISVSKPDIYIRSAAADLTQWINGRLFSDYDIKPAEFISAELDEMDPRMDDYLVWRIDFKQSCVFGDDPDVRTGGLLRRVYVGLAPDIGEKHIADYRLIYEATDAGDSS